ncbi:esterase-like activity of phytase family protein [Bradyrhizobium sp. LHD-71]|uniref:esterase-like activity of phytase family protein n=1 Tax=Bradyrhizobium sp. LHD-71 TaxID=3072141 RepID=UPI0028101723|nr:esterase-like activity of phytase family protein [Bradyrhizobium sp. LHD-71]MDQ8732813.1 esterase-like activity of phytase family protein [Bradyrhizobium sp. LHD-71]
MPGRACAQAAAVAAPVTTAVEVTSRPLEAFDLRDRTRRRFGDLVFRSGLVLTSSFKEFGGLSAFRIEPNGKSFVAMNDKGDWFTGSLVYQGKALAGLTDVRSAPMLGADGRPITLRKLYDSESLAVDGTTLYVGIERVNRILKFDFRRGGVASRGEEIPMPAAFRRLPYNKGPEGLVFVPKGLPLEGTLIVVSERGLNASGNLVGFLVGGPRPGQFSIRRSRDFDISDAALLPSGDLLILERKFSMLAGVGIRIRRIPLRVIAPGAIVDGPSIFEADLGHEIDNMEGLDVHRTADGDTVLTMVSDDNFSMLQRTLLLQFTLVDD